MTPQYTLLCPKLDLIPSEVIEAAALPYLKRHVSDDKARKAVAFWSSSQGMRLHRKLIAELETGVHNRLTEEDLRLLEQVNKSDFGRALSAFAQDREGSIAIARAMLNFKP